MPAHGTGPGARLADIAPQEEQVEDLLDGRNGVLVLGKAHGPAGNDGFGSYINFRYFFQVVALDSGFLFNPVPFSGFNVFPEIVEVRRVLPDERVVEDLSRSLILEFENPFHDPF